MSDDQAAETGDGSPYYWGRCPDCHETPLHVGVADGRSQIKLTNWMVCHDCEVMWSVGRGLMTWPFEDELPPQTLNEAGISAYRIIDCAEAWDGPKLDAHDGGGGGASGSRPDLSVQDGGGSGGPPDPYRWTDQGEKETGDSDKVELPEPPDIPF